MLSRVVRSSFMKWTKREFTCGWSFFSCYKNANDSEEKLCFSEFLLYIKETKRLIKSFLLTITFCISIIKKQMMDYIKKLS